MLLPEANISFESEAYTDVARNKVISVKKMDMDFMVDSCGLE